MALLQRTRILPQQRLDLPDFRNIEDFVCADFKAQFKNIWTGENFVLKGFVTTGIGTNAISMALAGSALIVGADDGTMFIGAPSLSPATSDALTPASTNYVELSIEQDTGGADSRAFWDPTAAAGQGGEFSQIVDTFIFTKAQLNINTSNFTGAADRVPVCEVDVNGSGIITDIRDARNMFWRLGRRGQDTFQYSWASRTEPPVSQFNGADKDIDSEKAWKDAVMSRILELDGGTHWFEDSGVSNVGAFRNVGLSMVTGQSTDAKWSWDGSLLKLTDSNVSPLDADAIASIRLLDSTANLMLTRQDGTGGSTAFALADGDVLWVELPEPLANTNYNGIGLTASNFRVSPRGSVPNDDTTFWLAMRDGANVYLRFFGELQPGEDVEISDNINENILAAIGIATETDMPNYTSNNYVVDGTSLVAAVSALDAAAGIGAIGANQDRSLKLIEGGTWNVDYLGTTLSWSADAFIDVPEVTRVSNRILAGNINLPNANSVAYVQINRASGPASLTVNVADIDALTPDGDTVIIARRVSTGILVGRSCFLLKAGEYLELDGALAEINRKLGQLKLRPHETAVNKARIDAADITQLDDSILSQIIGDFLLKFDGAVINFTTGVINEADDTTPLGVNFTPFTIPAGEYFWYGVSLIPGNVLADNTQEAQVQIDLAASANASASVAAKPVISGDIKLGAIQVQNNGGNIELVEVRKLGVGSGSGSGSGDASAVDTALRDRFSLNNFLFLTENIFRTDKDTKLDLASTGSYSPAKKAFGFANAAETLVSSNHLDSDFLDDGIDVSEIEFYLFWLAGFIDTGATYEVSRDGGTNWQTAAMERIGQTNAYRVHHTFTDEVTQQNLVSITPTGAGTALNATTAQQLSSQLVLSDTSVLKILQLSLNRAAAAVGNLYVQIVKNNAGVPSLDPADIIAESNAIAISGLGTGDLTLNVDMPDVTLTPDTYHVVLRTDAAYKAGTMDLSWRSAAGTNGAAYNGTSYTGGASTKAFVAQGRELDLRVRVTSSVGDVFVEGYGVYYDSSIGIQPSSTRKIQKFVFSGDDNETEFACNFQLDPYIVTVHDVYRGQSYVPDSSADSPLRVDGNTLKFAADTFDFPGETIVLIVRQLEGNGVDVSQENSAKIFEIEQQLVDIGDELAASGELDCVVLSKIAAPNTTIVNRALIPNLLQDLKPRFGIDRVMVQDLYEIPEESGPNGEIVYGVPNDKLGQIRFVGSGWLPTGKTTTVTSGTYIETTNANDYVEVTFAGTGLNLLSYGNSAPTWFASIDGGGEINISPAATVFTGGAGRFYGFNTIYPVVAGLTYGIHTVKIRMNSGYIDFHGFEFITEQASGLITIPSGSQLFKGNRLDHNVLETVSFNSGFNSGVLGNKGGRVLGYQNPDGSMAKDLTPVNASIAYLNAASHSNEELVRTVYYREMGASRADDFSLNFSNVNRAFTADDGTTSLIGQGVSWEITGGVDCMFANNSAGNYIAVTFIGCGLDLVIASSGARACNVTVDGTAAGALNLGGATRPYNQKIVSGLPYGTHTVRLTINGASTPSVVAFKIYQPKTPSLPAGAKKVYAYNILADYTPNTVAGMDTTSTGVIWKASTRELNYVGSGWNSGLVQSVQHATGWRNGTAQSGDYMEYFFYGTGIDLKTFTGGSDSNNVQVSLQNLSAGGSLLNLTTANFPSLLSAQYGASFNSGTGVASFAGASQQMGISLYNLPRAFYRIRFQNNAALLFQLSCIAVVGAGIHSHKMFGPVIRNNVAMIGSQGIEDLRTFAKTDVPLKKYKASANGFQSTITNTSATYVPMNDMGTAFYTDGGTVEVTAMLNAFASVGSGNSEIRAFIDGKEVPVSGWMDIETTAGQPQYVGVQVIAELSKGVHFMQLYWKNTGGGTASSNSNDRAVFVKEVS